MHYLCGSRPARGLFLHQLPQDQIMRPLSTATQPCVAVAAQKASVMSSTERELSPVDAKFDSRQASGEIGQH